MWRLSSLAPALFSLLTLGCRIDMHDQPRYEPYQKGRLFADGRASRDLPEGTVARGQLVSNANASQGDAGLAAAKTIPFPVTKQVLDRGQERFNIFCSPCHGYAGEGNGMIVQRGFSAPPSYYSDRVRNETVGHYYDVITNGFGAMYSYASRVPPADRWAIAAYIRALQATRPASPAASAQPERQPK
ncbi:MAG: cytochrome c [Bryobacteraceae bacterium]|nr:cytochrome c [Bryobacteraceae bacterium]